MPDSPTGDAPLDRTALVTGAATGIGAATARALEADGVRVFRVVLPAQLADLAGLPDVLAADLRDMAAISDLVQRLDVAPDIVIANAGVATSTPLLDGVDETFRSVLEVNLFAVHQLFAATLPAMRERGWGRLLATVSGAGYRGGWRDHVAYCAAKAGAVGLVRAYAHECGSDGVTANAVSPGLIVTPMSLDPVNSYGVERIAAAAAGDRIPVGRAGEPEEVAAVHAFLASPASGYINGQVLTVDGGSSVS